MLRRTAIESLLLLTSSSNRIRSFSISQPSSPSSSCSPLAIALTNNVYEARRNFHSGLDEARMHRLRRCSITINKLRGRDEFSQKFEKRIILESKENEAGSAPSDDRAAVSAEVRLVPARLLSSSDRRELLSFMASCIPTRDSTSSHTPAMEKAVRHLQRECDSCSFHLANGLLMIFVVEPNLDVATFRWEEAQIELMTAYRNVLCEVAESKNNKTLSVVRVPLVCETTGQEDPRFRGGIAKLTQQALIKAFHRIPLESKELLLTNEDFVVKLTVPQDMLATFQTTFLEEAWPVPTSTVNPGRLDLYPGLPPPKKMLEFPGWIGKRQELIDAVEKQDGTSFLDGARLTLDGRPVEKEDVYANVDVFSSGSGRKATVAKMLEGEAASAKAAGLQLTDPWEDPLILPEKP